jgi:FtsH-binding integral membrane protein
VVRKTPERRPSPLWYLLLLAPFVAMFWVSSYNSVEPAWGGIPFFYWYQLLWIPIGAALTLIVYFATQRSDRR